MRDFLYNLATDKSKGFFAGILKFFLFIISFIYGLLVSILIFLNRLFASRLEVKVISVGNITLGGTGKTALVESIAAHLKQKGHKVAVLTRGYKRKFASCTSRAAGYESIGDEPYMLSKNLGDIPVIVDADRLRAAKKALKDYHVDTVILDDGFQQWRIKKDLEIVAIDVVNPFGNQRLIPRGILREPLSSLSRADIFVLTKVNLNPNTERLIQILEKLNPKAIILKTSHQPLGFYEINKPNELLSADILKGKSAALFCGIGDPDSFKNLIETLGIKIGLFFNFADHHDYTEEDLGRIFKDAKDENLDAIITTEKDAARLTQRKLEDLGCRVFVLRIKIQITKDEQGFFHRLLGLYPL